jgi:tRNA A37 threonylcarbamoyladenosine dehydratase
MPGASVLAARHVYMVKKPCSCLRMRTSASWVVVGSWAAEALARTGIGAITLIDMDDVCVTNTNRQIHALRDNVGLAKSEVMAERIRLINPECRVTVIDDL